MEILFCFSVTGNNVILLVPFLEYKNNELFKFCVNSDAINQSDIQSIKITGKIL